MVPKHVHPFGKMHRVADRQVVSGQGRVPPVLPRGHDEVDRHAPLLQQRMGG